MSKSAGLINETKEYLAQNYDPLPVVLTQGEGVWVWDVEGNKYLDMLSSYSANNFGHCHPSIVRALVSQARRLDSVSRYFYTDVLAEFGRTITEFCHMDRVLPANGGAEAVETAIKLARKWGHERKAGVKPDSAEIIWCENNFHGRTIAIISASTNPKNKKGFGPFTPGFRHVPFGDPDALGRAINKNTVAFILEPIQGEGGIIVPEDGYLREVRKICDKFNVLMILDEIQTGFGRTGRDFAYQYENIEPDVLILGKALGGGMLPVSAVLSRNEIMEVFTPGVHGSTFGGNPLACAVAVASINLLIERNFDLRASSLGQYFMAELKKINSPLIREVRGKGLLIGLELVKENEIGRRFCEAMLKLGILCSDTKDNVIRFAPPLVIEKKEINWAVEKIRLVLRHLMDPSHNS